jgi:hypothetical protein
MMTIIRFDRHEDAKKWNTMHEERIRMGGHLATITLSILVGLLSRSVTAGIAASASSGILKDEMQARIWYPEVFQGWLLTRYYTFRYEQYPHQNFYMEWTDVIQDETGKERERHKHAQSHCKVDGPSGIPEKLVRDLMTRTPKFNTVSFK